MKTSNTVAACTAQKMTLAKRLVFSLLNRLQHGHVRLIDGDNDYCFGSEDEELRAELTIVHPQAYKRLLFGGSIGAAEAYVEGLWQTDNLVNLIRIFSRNLPALKKYEDRFAWLSKPFNLIRHRSNRNNKSGSRTNIAAHYDLSNEMYRMFLDPHMQYSSAIFPHADANLEQAQEHKLRTICERLQLTPDDHLLEIGTGWGGLACFAAIHYGCKVTTTTISKAQYDIARQRVNDESLQSKVTLLLDDYRDLKGQYSKIVSVEMIEAVGHEFMPEYFNILDRLLEPGGKLLIQAITIEDQRYDEYRTNVDFIQRYIFPGGHLPSVSEICRHIKEQTNMRLNHFVDYGQDYANTLKEWGSRFDKNHDAILNLGFSEDFYRLWQYYFSYSEGGFREAVIGLAHIETVKAKYS
ncbi:SAM-dependent methyltransferase [Dasania marina]|uniref:SAM-dependent methyltransferase n=1 Tax=Dasania marina TaxID=471499 RepID=UPI0003637557|nr:cyclopropane-fatty-acyl-phospholipid synthase family protein [Dasania marina]